MKRYILIFGFYLFWINTQAQQAYFVDGYHGGIYGHYPLWVTQFMVDKLAQHPEWKLGLEIEPETWDTVRVKSPAAYASFSKLVLDRRIEFTNPTYAQPYGYNISGESLIRQFEYGIKRLHRHFPGLTFTTYAVEEPCFTSSLPQLLKQFGFRYAVLKSPNTCWGGYARAYGGQLVNWIGPDGTSILTVPRYQSEALEENSTWQTTAWNNSVAFLQSSYASGITNPVGMCYQDAGWKNGPWLGYGNNIKNKSIYVTWREYFEEISDGSTQDDWRLSQEDFLVNLMWGSQALQRIGQQVRTAENSIVMGEKLSAMANIANQYVPAEQQFSQAWESLMMAQHHDSWIVPYNQLNSRQNWIEAIKNWTDSTNTLVKSLQDDAIGSFNVVTNANEEDVQYIRVYNTLPEERTEAVSVQLPALSATHNLVVSNSKGEHLPHVIRQEEEHMVLTFRPTVPSFGFASYVIQQGKQSAPVVEAVSFDAVGNCIIENENYRIVLDKSRGGSIHSLIAKKLDNKEFAIRDGSYALGELSGFFYETHQFQSSKESPATFKVLADNGMIVKVEITGNIASHPYTQVITLEAGEPRIDFDLTIDWKNNVGIGEYKQGADWTENRRAYTNDRYKLKVMFPNSLERTKLFKNAPFDVCESRLDSTFFSQWDRIEHNIILNWVDLLEGGDTYGLALFSDHTTSYGHGPDQPLSLTAQYSGIGLWGMDYKIDGPSRIKYALFPHRGKWDDANISAHSNRWNEPLVAVLQAEIPLIDRSYVKVEQPGLEISTIKVTDNDILLRLYNAAGDSGPQKISLGFLARSITEVLLNGEEQQRLATNEDLTGTGFKFQLPRHGIKTFLIKK